MQLKAYKYRLYPTAEQQQDLARYFGAKRWIFNHYLHENKQRFMKKEKMLSHADMCKDITNLKKIEDTQWLRGVDSILLQIAADSNSRN